MLYKDAIAWLNDYAQQPDKPRTVDSWLQLLDALNVTGGAPSSAMVRKINEQTSQMQHGDHTLTLVPYGSGWRFVMIRRDSPVGPDELANEI